MAWGEKCQKALEMPGKSFENRFTRRRSLVRVQQSPPFKRYTNTLLRGSVAVYRNVFALIVEIDDYEGETHLQTKRATYKDIRAWVKKNYGLHVSNLAISWTKDLCGLAKLQHKGTPGPNGPYAAELTHEKAEAIRAAFISFGIIKSK